MEEDVKQSLIWGPIVLLVALGLLGGMTKGCQWDHDATVTRIRALSDCSTRTGKPLECKAAINP